MTSLLDFNTLVQQVSPVMDAHIREIVIMFEKDIASKRRSSLVDSFRGLVELLVKRGYIDPSIRSTWSYLDPVCRLYAKRDFVNEFSHSSNSGVVGTARLQNSDIIGPPQGITTPLDPRVLEYLSSRIGKFSWRSFARLLNVTESDISIVQKSFEPNYSRCVEEVLRIYIKNQPWASSTGNTREDILFALEALPDYKDVAMRFKKMTMY